MYGPGLDLPLERFERILDQMPWLESIKLMGAGEPLLHPQFFELVRRAKRRNLRVWSVTNGTTLHLEEVRREIMESELDELWVSLDGATPETHARWKGGSDLNQIVDGVRRLVGLRGHAGLPRLATECTGNPDNIAELPALVNLAADLGIEELTYVNQPSSWGRDSLLPRLERSHLDLQSPEFTRQIEESREQARRRGVVFKLWAAHRFSPKRPCFWPWESCFISADGYITSCAVVTDPRLRNFGRIDDTPFRVTWNSPEYQSFRRAHREQKISTLCRLCYGLDKDFQTTTQHGTGTVSDLCDSGPEHQ
jgi:radical SAM protein with 4Fe4S-binding SPASM domain